MEVPNNDLKIRKPERLSPDIGATGYLGVSPSTVRNCFDTGKLATGCNPVYGLDARRRVC